MTYINIVLMSALLLSACATQQSTPDQQPSLQGGDKPLKETSDADFQKYREALTLLGNGELDKAESALTEFSKDKPGLAGPWANLALIKIKQNKLDEAEVFLQKAKQRNPEMPQIYNLLGYIEKQRGNIIKARDDYTRAVELKDDYAVAHYNLALIYDIYIQDIPKAIAHYQKYMSLTKNKDKKTADWLNQLKASSKKG